LGGGGLGAQNCYHREKGNEGNCGGVSSTRHTMRTERTAKRFREKGGGARKIEKNLGEKKEKAYRGGGSRFPGKVSAGGEGRLRKRKSPVKTGYVSWDMKAG